MHNIIRPKASFDSLNVDTSFSGKGKFSLPTLRRYSSTTSLRSENVNTPQILHRSLSSIFRKIPKTPDEKREFYSSGTFDDDNSSITSSDSSIIDEHENSNHNKSNKKFISIFGGGNDHHSKKKKFNFGEIIVSNEIIITSSDIIDEQDAAAQSGYLTPSNSPLLATYETHLHTPTHNYSYYYPPNGTNGSNILPILDEEISSRSNNNSRSNSVNSKKNNRLLSVPDSISLSLFNNNNNDDIYSSTRDSTNDEVLDLVINLSNPNDPNLSDSQTPNSSEVKSLYDYSASTSPASASPVLTSSAILPKQSLNEEKEPLPLSSPQLTKKKSMVINETWPFARFPQRSAFHNLSNLPPPSTPTRSRSNSNASHLEFKPSSPPPPLPLNISSTSPSLSEERSVEERSTKEKSAEEERSVEKRSTEEEISVEERSVESVYGICEKCKNPRTGVLWCQTCYTTIFEQNFSNWNSGSNKINQFIKNIQLSSNNISELIEWLPFEKFRDLKLIGEGGYSTIYLAKWNEGRILYLDENGEWERTGENDVILKILKDSKDPSQEYLDELEIYHKCTPNLINILRCYGLSQDPFGKNTIMVMEYAKDGNLKDYLKNNFKELTWIKRISIINDIAKSLKSIHSAELIHKNLHSGNVLIHDDSAFIGDLGLCNKTNNNNNHGVMPYVAPEILKGNEFDMASDIYSFGMIMYELATSLPPYYNYSSEEYLLRAICNGIEPKVPTDGIPNCFVELMNKCWSPNPKDRPNADYIAQTIEDWNNNFGTIQDFDLAEKFRLNNNNSNDENGNVREKLLGDCKSKALPIFRNNKVNN